MEERAENRHDPWTNPEPATVETAVVWTLAYADVFDYPLTWREVHRYLVGREAAASAVHDLLINGAAPKEVTRKGEYFTLPGRERVVEVRRQRASAAAETWPKAVRFGRAMARLPYVRMVAVTGALSMDNATPDDDIDYLIVTETGRLWLSRAIIIQFVVKPAARDGIELCPNYLLTERAFTHFSRNLFTAHEIVQMVVIAGVETYRRMCRSNRWVSRFLPNGYGRVRGVEGTTPAGEARRIVGAAERALRSPIGGRLERWEMGRKIRRFERQGSEEGEASFSPEWCKGHFGSHEKLVREAVLARLASIDEGRTA